MAKKSRKKKGPKYGGAALPTRGNQSYRSPGHLIFLEFLEELRRKRELRIEQIASRLPAWARINESQLAKILRAERDVTYQEAREICEAIGLDLAAVDSEVERRLKAGVIPTDPRKKKKD